MTTPPSGSVPGGAATGKGRPTPKRSEAQRHRRGGPVAPPPKTRKEASQRAKLEARAARERVRVGSELMPRDAGPVRALVRDVIDSRRSVGVLMLPLALVLVLVQLSGNRDLFVLALNFWIVGVLALLADIVWTTVVLRRRLRQEHPEVRRLRGHIVYGLMRSTVFRRWRIPAPRVSPGGAPV